MTGLDTLRVLELSTGVAGAYCGKLLADAGAAVTVVEPAGGHPLRRRRPMEPPADAGLLFDFLTQRKELLPAAALEHAGPAALDGVGLVVRDRLTAATAAVAPGVDDDGVPLVVEISPFGADGPWCDRPAAELVVQALSGTVHRRGLPGGAPLQAGGAVLEFVAGSYAAAAAAVYWWGTASPHTRQRRIDVSMLECAVVSMIPFSTLEAELGLPGTVRPVRAPNIPSIEPSADGYVGFSTITAQQLHDFFAMIERPDLADDPAIARLDVRQGRRAELLEAIHAWTACRSTEEIVAVASALRIPVAPIGNGENLPRLDHMVAREVFAPGPGGVLAPRVPYRFHDGAASESRSGDPSGGQSASPDVAADLVGARPADGLPLAGLVVVDLTAFWAGPAATHLLASLGAEVVKVESIQRPDAMRFTTTRPEEPQWWEWGAVFHGVNANKRSVTLDMGDARGRSLLLQLVAQADVVIENFSPRVMEHFDLGWPQVHACNPRAIMVRMPAFGLTGPWRDRTGFAMTVEQASGLAWQTGYEDGPPMDVGGVCDPLGGMHAVVAVMAALGRRQRSGEGCLLEVPLVEVALNVAAEHVLQYSANGTLLRRLGNRSMDAVPQGVYACRGDDRWIAIAVTDDAQWDALSQRLPADAWAEEPPPPTASAQERWAHRDRIDQALAAYCATVERDDLVAQLVAAGVPAAAVCTAAETMDHPQLVARGFFEQVDHPVIGRYRLPSLPFVEHGRPRGWTRTSPPTLGQHTAEVLSAMAGVGEDDLRGLAEDGVVGTAPVGR